MSADHHHRLEMEIIHEDREKEIDLRRHTGVKIDREDQVMKIDLHLHQEI
jgi:hypothetical protein